MLYVLVVESGAAAAAATACPAHILQSMRRDILHCLIVVADFFFSCSLRCCSSFLSTCSVCAIPIHPTNLAACVSSVLYYASCDVLACSTRCRHTEE